MSRTLTLLAAGFALALALGCATGASASARHQGCCGGPLPPTVHVHTVYPHKSYTVVHVEHHKQFVPREHDVIHVTRVQPVIDVHHVNHVITDLYPRVYTVHKMRTVRLPAMVHESYSTTYATHCGCQYGY